MHEREVKEPIGVRGARAGEQVCERPRVVEVASAGEAAEGGEAEVRGRGRRAGSDGYL